MLRFKDFLFFDDLDRIVEGIDDHQPLDGRWDNPLSSSNNYATYKFNVPGDDCGTTHSPCYAVSISGSPTNPVSIAFSRGGSYSDQHRGVGMTVFKGVLKALSEYITTLKPAGLSWSAVQKSVPNPHTGKIVNPEARAHVYEGWAVRNLFPEKYVGMQGQWIRRDLYDSQYVTTGYPPVPEGISGDSSSGEKTAALEKMKETAENNRREIAQREDERREAERESQRAETERRQEEERRLRVERDRVRQERIAAATDSPEQNPNQLKDGDTVFIDGEASNVPFNLKEMPAKVVGFRMGQYRDDDHSDELYVQIQFASEEHDPNFNGAIYFVDAKELKKESPEFAAQRETRRQEVLAQLVSNREVNPNGVQEGDNIITDIEGASADNEQNGLLGKITRFKPGNGQLDAFVDWDEHAKQVLTRYLGQAVSVKFLKKATPEVMQQITHTRREAEIERQVQASRNRRPQRQAEEPQSTADIEALVNHPANPQHFRPGDLVKVNGWRHNGRGAVILSLEKPYWSEDNISANVRFHGSRAARPTRVWSLSELERDTSPQAQALQTRQQQQQDRQQRISSGTNGLQIGDTITVSTGVHRGKTGRILSFRTSGQNITAVVASHEGNFNVNVRAIANNAQPVAAESLSFFRYYLDKNEVI